MNSAVDYCYRDAANWKQYGTVVFAGAPTDDLTARLKHALHDDLWFIADQLRVPEVFFDGTSDDDHCWHEFVEISPTEEAPTDIHVRSFTTFVEEVERAAAEGWREFSAWERVGSG
jgi:hypothetical protein